MEQFVSITIKIEKPPPYICWAFDFWVNFKDSESFIDWIESVRK